MRATDARKFKILHAALHEACQHWNCYPARKLEHHAVRQGQYLLCGGAADVADLLIRRGFTHGLDFDIVCGYDLSIRKNEESRNNP